jgi:transmembrane sensor
MNIQSSEQHSTSSIRAQAADWLAQMQNPDATPDTRDAFEQWRNTDIRHALAFEQCRSLWLMSQELKNDTDIQRELNAARARKKSRTHNNRWYLLATAATFLVISVGVFFQLSPKPIEYSTAIAEQRLIQLEDGSSALLNTDSVLEVHFTGSKRALQLKKGEAYFSVAKDPQRPFEVTAATGVVRAVGTEFNVALLNKKLTLDVTEGVVEFKVKTAANNPLGATVKQGEAINFNSNDTQLTIQPANTARINAWKSRKIYFSADTLENAVAEYNRYTKKQIVILHDELKQQKISGMFNADDVDTFIFSLEQLLDVRVERHQGKILIMRK